MAWRPVRRASIVSQPSSGLGNRHGVAQRSGCSTLCLAPLLPQPRRPLRITLFVVAFGLGQYHASSGCVGKAWTLVVRELMRSTPVSLTPLEGTRPRSYHAVRPRCRTHAVSPGLPFTNVSGEYSKGDTFVERPLDADSEPKTYFPLDSPAKGCCSTRASRAFWIRI